MSKSKSVQTVVLAEVATSFDYGQIEDEASREKLKDASAKIKTAYRNVRQEMIEIGQELLAVKDLLGHGQWCSWLQAEFTMSTRTAQNFMAVAKNLPNLKNASLAYLTSEAVYLLAAKNTPEDVRSEVLERVEKGETLDRKAVQELIETVRPKGEVELTKRQCKSFHSALRGGQVDSLVQYLRERPDEERGELVDTLKWLLAKVEG